MNDNDGPGNMPGSGVGRILRAESAVSVEIPKITDFLRIIALPILNKSETRNGQAAEQRN
jgi:hypothetical protein